MKNNHYRNKFNTTEKFKDRHWTHSLALRYRSRLIAKLRVHLGNKIKCLNT